MKHLDTNNVLVEQQHEFRKGFSCETQLLLMVQDLASTLDEGKLLDFSKAFDKVPHARLLCKLRAYNLEISVINWISPFLSGRTQRVTVTGCMSDAAAVVSGVPQGSVLGPLLFLLYINDISSRVQVTVTRFSDDTVLYREVGSEDDSKAHIHSRFLAVKTRRGKAEE